MNELRLAVQQRHDVTAAGPSLQHRILGWLVAPLALISGLMLAEVYYTAQRSTERVQDQMLLAQAFGISQEALASPGDLLLLDIIQRTTDGTVFYRVIGPAGSFVSGYSGVPGLPAGVTLDDGDAHFYHGEYRGERVRTIALRKLVANGEVKGPMTVFVAQPTAPRERLVWDQVRSATARFGLLTLLATLLVWGAVVHGLRPLARLERAIKRRSIEDLRPIDVSVPREIASVVAALNGLLTRLHDSIDRNKRFIANASHQLRTPVASLLAATELALRDSGRTAKGEAVQRAHTTALSMSRLIAQLLTLARADAVATLTEPVDLVAVAREVTAERVPDALARQQDLGFESTEDSLIMAGNAVLVSEMIANLVDNACSYCPAGSSITVCVRREHGIAVLEVADDGPGIAPSERDRVLERFTRLDEGAGKGSGLGLAISLEVARAHGGRLELDHPAGTSGLVVRVEMPAAPD